MSVVSSAIEESDLYLYLYLYLYVVSLLGQLSLSSFKGW